MYSGIKYLFHPIMACQRQNIIECRVGFPIRKSAGQRVLSPRRGLSQSATSFIASYRQGIHQTPFSRLIRASERMTFLHRYAMQKRANAAIRAMPARKLIADGNEWKPAHHCITATPIHTFLVSSFPIDPDSAERDRLVSACIPCRRKVCF